jgi:cytochrome c oxidase subunit 2
MKIDLYEKIWMIGTGCMLALFFSVIAYEAVAMGRMPPSHIETIDPKTVLSDARFNPQGVRVGADGSINVHVVGLMFVWLPGELTLPAGKPVTFHITSVDVTHGYEIVRTNAQSMVIPGYVSQFTTTFDPGEYLVVCNEYCGNGHHTMFGKLHVVPADQWQAPATAGAVTGGAPVVPSTAGGDHDH